jgi:hypothetical protein
VAVQLLVQIAVAGNRDERTRHRLYKEWLNGIVVKDHANGPTGVLLVCRSSESLACFDDLPSLCGLRRDIAP